jgi:general secretion pathway protein C
VADRQASARKRATTPREWAIAVAGGLALSAGLVWVLRGSGPAEAPVELSATPAPPAVAAPIAAPVTAAVTAPISAPITGMTLRGLMVRPGAAASAIIESADGRQRLVRAGTPLGNGLTVESIDAGGVVIAGGGGRQTLSMPDSAPRLEPAAGGRVASAPLKALAATANDYRLAMKPRKAGGAITGYVVTDVARLPALRMAGMVPGDVLISVNGSGVLSEEKLLEMPAEIAGAYAFDVVFERAGQQQRAVVKIER